MEALEPSDVNSGMKDNCQEVYYASAELKDVSYLDGCAGGHVEFCTYVYQEARIEVYKQGDKEPYTIEHFDRDNVYYGLVEAIKEFAQEVGSPEDVSPLEEVRITFSWVGNGIISDIYDKRGGLVTSDLDYFCEQVEWDSPTFKSDLSTICFTRALEEHFDKLQAEAEREVSARFVNILNRYYA